VCALTNRCRRRGAEAHEARLNYTLNSKASLASCCKFRRAGAPARRPDSARTPDEIRPPWMKRCLVAIRVGLELEGLARTTVDQVASDSRFVEIGRQRPSMLARVHSSSELNIRYKLATLVPVPTARAPLREDRPSCRKRND
jgi:hypothetical protein